MTLEVPVRERRGRRLRVWPDVERYLDRAMRGLGPWGFRRWPRLWPAEEWLPEIDVFEKEGKIIIRADLPGVKPDDIEVTVEGDMLTIRGKREEEKEVKEEDYYFCERSAGEFSRTVRLPEGVSAEMVEASYQSGVLEVSIPRPAAVETKAVKVPIK